VDPVGPERCPGTHLAAARLDIWQTQVVGSNLVHGTALFSPQLAIVIIIIIVTPNGLAKWYRSWFEFRYIPTEPFFETITSGKNYSSVSRNGSNVLCKIWGVHGGHYEVCRLLGYKTPVRTSQETHYVSTTEPSRLMLCKTWGLHGNDYEECRLLGYKTPVRTSQETHYVSVTESNQLMLCKIRCFNGDHYEEWRLWNVTRCGSRKNWRFGET
jgi:hypothetical protein